MDKVCLSILYKDQNPKNLETIERLYGSKFDRVCHVIPLYNGDKENCIKVYENKFQLSGYIPQALERIKNDDYTHYVFMTDDCLLNPDVNSSNLREMLSLGEYSAFASDDIYAVTQDIIAEKDWALPSIFNFLYGRNGAEVKDFLPKKAEIRKIYEQFGFKAPYIYVDYIKFLLDFLVYGKKQNHPFYFDLNQGNVSVRNLNKFYESKVEKEKQITIYPFAAFESEFFVIPKNIISDFSYYCGIFSAARLHYNIAFATAICLCAEKLISPKDLINIKEFSKTELNSIDAYSNFDSLFKDKNNALIINCKSSNSSARRLCL